MRCKFGLESIWLAVRLARRDPAPTSSVVALGDRSRLVNYPIGLIQLTNFRGATVQETVDHKAWLCYSEREQSRGISGVHGVRFQQFNKSQISMLAWIVDGTVVMTNAEYYAPPTKSLAQSMEVLFDWAVVFYIFILWASNWMLAADITFTIASSMCSLQLIVSIKVLPCMDHFRAKLTHRGVRPSTSSILPCAIPTGPRIEQERHARANKRWAIVRISCRVRGDIGVELINIVERWC